MSADCGVDFRQSHASGNRNAGKLHGVRVGPGVGRVALMDDADEAGFRPAQSVRFDRVAFSAAFKAADLFEVPAAIRRQDVEPVTSTSMCDTDLYFFYVCFAVELNLQEVALALHAPPSSDIAIKCGLSVVRLWRF